MTLLTVISGDEYGAAVECGVTPPTSIIGSSDPNAPLFLRRANQVGRELAKRHDWQKLKVDFTFTSLATEAQTALPSAFQRFLPYVEMWNRSLAQPYSGPTDDYTWGRIKGMSYTAVTPGYWRIIGGGIEITPAPTAGQTIAIPYISKNWVRPSGGTGSTDKAYFTVDTDSSLIDEELLALGIVWSWKSSKGFDYAEFMATHEREMERACSRDRGPQAPIVMSRAPTDAFPSTWPGVVIP